MSSSPLFPVRYPEQMNAAFAEAYNSGKLEHLLALYTDNAVHVGKEGVDEGREAIARGLAELLQLGGMMRSENVYSYVSTDVALLRGRWSLHLPDGQVIARESSEVVRRQPSGEWRYVIDHPWGAC